MAQVAVLQHYWCEHAGVYADALTRAGHSIAYYKLCDGVPVPPPTAADGWIVMGGPMNVDETDQYPWLSPERALLVKLIADDQPVLGVCLGAQLIARAAGARVFPKRPKEIGLFSIQMTPEAAHDPLFRHFGSRCTVFQWHGDTFDLPAGAVLLAGSERFAHQAFRLGKRVYAFQFHMESTPGMAGELAAACTAELAELPPPERPNLVDPRMVASLEGQNKLAEKLVLEWATMLT